MRITFEQWLKSYRPIMGGADTATFGAAMKTRFIGPIRDTLAKGKVLLFGDPDANPENFKGILGSAEGIDFVGNEFRIPLKARRNQAVGFRSENETLPAPGASSYTYLTEPLRYSYALFNITGQLLKAASSNEGAFVTALRQEMEDTVLSNKLDFDRAAHNDGTGVMGRVSAATPPGGANPVTLTNQANGAVGDDGTINFRGGEVIDFIDTTLANVRAGGPYLVTGVSRSALTITVSPTPNAAVVGTDKIVRASTDSTSSIPNNSVNKEIQGLKSIVSSTGTLHGVNPTTYPFWAATQTAIGGAISDTVLRNAKDNIGFESGADLEGGLDYAIVTTRGIRRRYADTLLANRQVVASQTVKLHGGFSALMFDENPIFADDATSTGNVYGLSLKDLFWAQASDWDWMDEDGKVLKWDTRRDRYIAVLYKYCQLGTTARNRHFRLTGVTDDTR